MSKFPLSATINALLLALFGVSQSAYAASSTAAAPTTNYVTNAIGEIYANPPNVYLPPNTAGNTQIIWKWNKRNNTSSGYACIYVVVNGGGTASVVQCERDDKWFYTNLGWIVAPNDYFFIISRYVGDNVSTGSLEQLSFKIAPGYPRSDVLVTGILSYSTSSAEKGEAHTWSAEDFSQDK